MTGAQLQAFKRVLRQLVENSGLKPDQMRDDTQQFRGLQKRALKVVVQQPSFTKAEEMYNPWPVAKK